MSAEVGAKVPGFTLPTEGWESKVEVMLGDLDRAL